MSTETSYPPTDDRPTSGTMQAIVQERYGEADGVLRLCNATIDAGPERLPNRAELDPDSLPHLAALGPAVAACDFPVEYERGIETLIGATRTQATSSS